MTTLERLAALKNDIGKYKAQADRAMGAINQLEQQLDKEFGCSVREAAKRLKVMEGQIRELDEEMNEGLNSLYEEWTRFKGGIT
jgi:hypothetical protein